MYNIWCSVSLSAKKCRKDLYRQIQIVADVVRQHSRLRWFGHLERKSEEDWVPVCSNIKVGEKCSVGRKTWGQYVSDEIELLGLQPE